MIATCNCMLVRVPRYHPVCGKALSACTSTLKLVYAYMYAHVLLFVVKFISRVEPRSNLRSCRCKKERKSRGLPINAVQCSDMHIIDNNNVFYAIISLVHIPMNDALIVHHPIHATYPDESPVAHWDHPPTTGIITHVINE